MRILKKRLCLLTFVSLSILTFAQAPQQQHFEEIWAYYLPGNSDSFDPEKMPVTDLCFFSGDVNCYGEISHFPSSEIIPEYNGRRHLVITCEGRSLTHFSIDPDYGVSKKLIKSIVKASVNFDGVQIDFENVPQRDAANFLKFLKDLRKSLGKKKMFTVCVPARNKVITEDVYDYATIEKYVDRVFIMAYDQHWSTSAPGAIAEIPWANRIAEFAKSVIPEEKIIMGMPFYGRTWQNENFGRAWLYSGIQRIKKENKVDKVQRDESGIPYFKFKKEITVTGWYDDADSLKERMDSFKKIEVKKIGFWRIGQEDTDFWKYFFE
ncbi:glycosyl hydrolase family 18 protein [Treponema sp.]|uniref:glycosyl hydrolase family 18 protein n=1 Tax=Treponema sp. TaxID=166 RepID=UPI0025D53E13|nr:glycosyl hydrolase family 18 protein [Treponema sp.]MCR5217473.1 glycoside hydrolase [Treponema sp.]